MNAEASVGLVEAQAYLGQHSSGSWLDMRVYSYSPNALMISMAADLSYSHQAALVFRVPSFFSGPLDEWTTAPSGAAVLRRLTARERTDLGRPDAAELETELFAIATDGPHPVLVGADDVELDRTQVFYYPRENLKPGQALAHWLRTEPS